MSIRKAFSRLRRTSVITNNVETSSASISATKITSGGYEYYVYLNPAPADSFSSSGIYTGSRVIKGGAISAGGSGNADVLVVAGGGGGGGGNGMGEGGGGGAGGVRYFPNIPIPSSPIPIQVGTGGVPTGSFSGTTSDNGQPSFFGPLYISYGGGGAGSGDSPSGPSGRRIAGQGGSGGGSGTWRGISPYGWPAGDPNYTQAGLGNIPPFSPSQGNNGGGNTTNNGSNLGGGGGASQIGGIASPAPTNAYGGAGAPYPAFPAPVLAPAIPAPLQPRWSSSVGPTGLFGGGGGGGRAPAPDPAAVSPGGTGGGGNGGAFPSNTGQSGATYTGGGGGGGYNAGQGGTGIIIIRKAI